MEISRNSIPLVTLGEILEGSTLPEGLGYGKRGRDFSFEEYDFPVISYGGSQRKSGKMGPFIGGRPFSFLSGGAGQKEVCQKPTGFPRLARRQMKPSIARASSVSGKNVHVSVGPSDKFLMLSDSMFLGATTGRVELEEGVLVSVPGAKFSHLKAEMDALKISPVYSDFDTIFCMCGTNYASDFKPAQFSREMGGFLDELRKLADGAPICMIGPVPRLDDANGVVPLIHTMMKNMCIAASSAAQPVYFFDFRSAFPRNCTYLWSDEVHLSDVVGLPRLIQCVQTARRAVLNSKSSLALHGFRRQHSRQILSFFQNSPDGSGIILLRGGDIETNPGPPRGRGRPPKTNPFKKREEAPVTEEVGSESLLELHMHASDNVATSPCLANLSL